jgi:hypothetical protein
MRGLLGKAISEIAANEPALAQDKNLAFDNCSSRSNRGLDAGGIPRGLGNVDQMMQPSGSRIPGSAGRRAYLDSGMTEPVLIPQWAGWQPRSIGQFMPK